MFPYYYFRMRPCIVYILSWPIGWDNIYSFIVYCFFGCYICKFDRYLFLHICVFKIQYIQKKKKKKKKSKYKNYRNKGDKETITETNTIIKQTTKYRNMIEIPTLTFFYLSSRPPIELHRSQFTFVFFFFFGLIHSIL